MANRRLNQAEHRRLINEMRRHWMKPHGWQETMRYGQDLHAKLQRQKGKTPADGE